MHPLWLRISHWVNALSCFIMITSGWKIYNASPLFDFSFPKEITLGGWLGGALLWHFSGMWLFVINGIFYVVMGIFTGRFKKKYLPFSMREFILNIKDVVKLKLNHNDTQHYNMLQKTAYTFILIDSIVIFLSGLVIWKSVQFSTLTELIGGYDNARFIHFYSMFAMVVFIVIHLIMVLLVPKTFLAMIRGR